MEKKAITLRDVMGIFDEYLDTIGYKLFSNGRTFYNLSEILKKQDPIDYMRQLWQYIYDSRDDGLIGDLWQDSDLVINPELIIFENPED